MLSGKQIANSYCVRKGLSRKAQLSMYLQKYMEKRPKSSVVLQKSLPKTHVIDTWEAFQTDDGIRMTFSERLDSCLWEIKSLMESKHGNRWILKPSATNKVRFQSYWMSVWCYLMGVGCGGERGGELCCVAASNIYVDGYS